MNDINPIDDARCALKLYHAGLPIDAILHRHPVSYFTQHFSSVWMTVFEKVESRDPLSAIERMGIYAMYSGMQEEMLQSASPDGCARSVARQCIVQLSMKAETPDVGMSLEEMVRTMRVFLGHHKLAEAIRAEADKNVQTRIAISEQLPTEQRVPNWVDNAREVKGFVDKIFGVADLI